YRDTGKHTWIPITGKEDDMTKKANHQANIVRISQIEKHPNADTLEIIKIGEYQVVSKIGQFKVGDLGVYIQPESVVPQTEPFRFIWEPHQVLAADSPYAFHSPVPERKRRITVRKFRKEWSEGLLLPISDFWTLDHFESNGDQHVAVTRDEADQEPGYLYEGQDISDLLGITHYDPDTESTKGENSNAPKLSKKYPKSLRGWYNFLVRKIKNFFGKDDLGGSNDNISLGIPVYDVDALKNYPKTFEDGEPVIVTEKIHGSNARFLFLEGVMYAGSRKLWKSPNSTCIFRRAVKELKWIEEWCREHEGYVLWGELTPTQGGFEYGSKHVQFFVFDIRTPDGKWLDREHDEAGLLAQLMDYSVPILYQGPYDLEVIKKFVDGPSMVPLAKNIREGVV